MRTLRPAPDLSPDGQSAKLGSTQGGVQSSQTSRVPSRWSQGHAWMLLAAPSEMLAPPFAFPLVSAGTIFLSSSAMTGMCVEVCGAGQGTSLMCTVMVHA